MSDKVPLLLEVDQLRRERDEARQALFEHLELTEVGFAHGCHVHSLLYLDLIARYPWLLTMTQSPNKEKPNE